jgi:secreted trypsin-like serine protease
MDLNLGCFPSSKNLNPIHNNLVSPVSVTNQHTMMSHVIFLILCAFTSKFSSVVGIIKGHDIDIEKRPYQAFLQHDGNRLCGGVILNRKFVITAAHCVYLPGSVEVYVGSKYPFKGELHHVIKRNIHPFFCKHEENWAKFDVALLELDSKLNYSASVQPIALPASNQSYSEGLLCQVTGWGTRSVNSFQLSNQLQTLAVKILRRENCTKVYEGFAAVDESMICGEDERANELAGPCKVSL